ncbi:MAG: thiamine phosphate synthase [bacterium]|nr:thiamine phosphate synthase [bacterium]
MKNINLTLYAVTDRGCLNGRNLHNAVQAALEGGVTLVQLREKDIPIDEYIREAKDIMAVCSRFGVPLLINDNVEVCLKSGADGVHLGQNDMPCDEARRLLGDKKIIGVTAKTVEQAQTAQKMGADYLGSGAVFGTSTKADAVKMDMETLKSICASVSIPVAAIGGINKQNIRKLEGSGISGAAIVSGIFGNDDIRAASKELYTVMEEIL